MRCSVSAGRALMRYKFPLNVRELHRALEAALVLTTDRDLELEDLPPAFRKQAEPNEPAEDAREDDTPIELNPEDVRLREEILEALRACAGNVTRAATMMGKHRQQMQRWMRRLRIGPKDYAK